MRALIDADILIYEAASICETSVPWPGTDGEHLWTRAAHMDEAWARLNDSIDVLMEKVGATSCLLAVTPKTNWRFNVWPDYKGHRKDSVKPLLVEPLRRRISKDDRGRVMNHLEGDDILGIAATHPRNRGDQIVVTIDKDLKTIPGRHYNFRDNLFFEIEEDEANMWWLRQTLEGDRTDNYPGCPTFGPLKAEKLVPYTVRPEDLLDVWREDIVPAFEDQGLDEDFALSQARVARILRYDDYNLTTGEVNLWTPSVRNTES